MRRMLSEEQLKKKILQYAPGGEGAVQSVNGKTGEVVLTASNIKATNSTSIQANLERIDLEVEGCVDDIADLEEGKLDASKSAVANVGGLVIPNNAPASDKLVGIDTSNGQELIGIGSGLTIRGGNLVATGGGTDGDTFIAEYDVTSFADILAAYQAGKNIIAIYPVLGDPWMCPLVNVANSTLSTSSWDFKFECFVGTSKLVLYCDLLVSGITHWSNTSTPFQAKLTAGTGITINPSTNVISATGGSGYETVICENSGNTPVNVEWDKITASGTEHVIGVLNASEDTYGKFYCVRKPEVATYNSYDKYITLKIWSEGAGEYIYGWEKL